MFGGLRRGSLHQSFLWLLIVILAVSLTFLWQQAIIFWFALRWIVRRVRSPWNSISFIILAFQFSFFTTLPSGAVLLFFALYFALQEFIFSSEGTRIGWRLGLDMALALITCAVTFLFFEKSSASFFLSFFWTIGGVLSIFLAEILWERRYGSEHDVF